MTNDVGYQETHEKIYFMLSQMAHSSSRDINDYLKIHEGRFVLDAGPSYNLVNEVLAVAFLFYHGTLEKIGQEFVMLPERVIAKK